ncbi:hypothetical protein ABT160_42625 [Streptomyces sp. NPDC001941]|uniref:hypothetical protein n=1 Tax=Streptomyces sp. NPDC001941 TaxID=3154659 RepID=UPI0033319E95
MNKVVTLRSAVILGAAVMGGSAAGTAAEALVHLTHQPLPGVVGVVTGGATLWFAERLDRMIGEQDSEGQGQG